MPLNGRMDKEIVEYIHIKYYSVVKKNDILNFAYQWMKIENTILSEITQTPKDEYGMYSLISGF